jgi:hypothetical protein
MFKASFELQYLRFLESKAGFGRFSFTIRASIWFKNPRKSV